MTLKAHLIVMLRDSADAQKFIITEITSLQFRYSSGSGTYIKVTVMETVTSEYGKLCPTPVRRNSRKIGDHPFTHMLTHGFLEVYVSLSTLGNEMFGYKSHYEEAASQRIPWPWELSCSPEESCGENTELCFSSTMNTARAACTCWSRNQTPPGPWEHIMATDVYSYSLLSLPGFTRSPCTHFAFLNLCIYP